jgi:hypothetical protein
MASQQLPFRQRAGDAAAHLFQQGCVGGEEPFFHLRALAALSQDAGAELFGRDRANGWM